MIKGTIEALRFIQTNKNESIDILAAYSRSDRETAVGMFESYFPAYSHDGSMSNEALQAALDDAPDPGKNGNESSAFANRRSNILLFAKHKGETGK